MVYDIVEKPGLIVAGLSIKTQREKAKQEVTQMWLNFFVRKIKKMIPHRSDPTELMGIYIDHDENFVKYRSGFYTAMAACRIEKITELPEGLFIKKIPPAKYAVFKAKGKLPHITIETWNKIYETNLKRAFSGELEVYKNGNQDLDNGEVEIYVSLL